MNFVSYKLSLKNFAMKKLYWLSVVTIFITCNTKEPDKPNPEINTISADKSDTANLITDSHYFWNVEWDQKKGMVMKKVTPLTQDSLTAPILIQKLNSLYHEIQLNYKKISGDTIFVVIHKSAYLTTQVGSTGAKGYLAEVIYNLTELKNVNYVDINFKKGDHAYPGTYSRTDFMR